MAPPAFDLPVDSLRWRGHLMLKEIGGAGQAKLKKSSLLVIGAGGLGAVLALFAAQAGLGKITLIDDDEVAPSDLARQGLFGEDDIARQKAGAAAAKLRRLAPETETTPFFTRLTAENALALIKTHDVVADASDNFATRFLTSDACFFARRPLVSAAVEGWSGQLSLFRPYEKNPEGDPLPTYRCLVPSRPPEPGSCSAQGLAGPLCGIMGSLQALEVIKNLTGAGQDMAGRVLLFDGLAGRARIINLPFDPQNPLTGKGTPPIRDLSIHA